MWVEVYVAQNGLNRFGFDEAMASWGGGGKGCFQTHALLENESRKFDDI